MKKYVCEIYEDLAFEVVRLFADDIPAGTPFEKLPDDWTCPDCGVGKDEFKPEDEKK